MRSCICTYSAALGAVYRLTTMARACGFVIAVHDGCPRVKAALERRPHAGNSRAIDPAFACLGMLIAGIRLVNSPPWRTCGADCGQGPCRPGNPDCRSCGNGDTNDDVRSTSRTRSRRSVTYSLRRGRCPSPSLYAVLIRRVIRWTARVSRGARRRLR